MTRWSGSLLLLLLSLEIQAQFPFHRTLEVDAGQRQPRISHLVQDSLGLLWAGSDLGVLRTDGERVEPMFRTETGQVNAMFAHGGEVYIAFATGALVRCAAGVCDTLPAVPELVAAPVRSMTRTADGALWLGTYGAGVFRLRAGVVERSPFTAGLPDVHVNDIAALDDRRVVVATDQGLAVVSDKGVEHVLDERSGAPDNLVMALAVLPDGSVVGGTDARGVFRWKPGTAEVVPLLNGAWPYGPVTRVAVEEHRLWVGTDTSGVVVVELDPDAGIHHQPSPTGAIMAFWRDRQGAMWWCDGTDRIHRADPAILYLPSFAGLDLRKVSALCTTKDRIWVATPSGIHHHPLVFNGNTPFQRVPVDLDPRTPVVSLAATRNGTIWAATFGSGVVAMAPNGTVRHFSGVDGPHNLNVLAARADGDSVWFATLDGASLWNGSGFKPVEGTIGFTFDVLPTGQGHALVATDGHGVLAFASDTATPLPTEARTFYSLVTDDQARPWAMGPGAGVCRLSPGAVACFGAELPLFAGDVYALASTRGRLLVLGERATMALDPRSGAWVDLTARLGTQGISAELNTVARTPDGTIWFACNEGLVRMRLNDDHFDARIPVVITGVLVGGENVPPTDVVHTTHDRNSVTIQLTGLYYPDPGALRFEYTAGDEGEVLRTRDRELAFAGLAPGTHRIRIRAFIGEPTADTEWRTIIIHIAPPWWRQPWVIGVLALVATGLLVAVVRTRERRLRDRERSAQEKVRFQLEALRSQVDPHFLFNSFNTLVALIETEPGSAVEHVEDLSTFFRNIVLVRDKELIPLQEELELLHSYFNLEQRRFGKAIALFVHMEHGADGRAIVPLTLQMLVENALKHNAATMHEPLAIHVTVEDEEVVVRNPIRPRVTAVRSTGFGLESIRKQYTAINSQAVVVERVDGWFVVRIPLIEHDGYPAH